MLGRRKIAKVGDFGLSSPEGHRYDETVATLRFEHVGESRDRAPPISTYRPRQQQAHFPSRLACKYLKQAAAIEQSTCIRILALQGEQTPQTCITTVTVVRAITP